MKNLPLTLACIMAIGLGTTAVAGETDSEIPDLTVATVKDFTLLPETPGLHWNLGPTGARGWVHGYKGHNGPMGRQILIVSVEKMSPSDGVLEPFDVLLGANGKPFTGDARRCLGMAITESETEERNGILKLTRWRAGETSEVTVQLEIMGTYSATSPYACRKTYKILKNSCGFLADHMPPEGFSGVGGALDALLLLSVDRPEYLDHVRRTAYKAGPPDLKLDKKEGLLIWNWSYNAILLSEYYAATGDTYVLPALREYVRAITEGQAATGSWGHNPAIHGMTEGYGEVNQVGLTAFLGLILARECGINVAQTTFSKSEEFFKKYANTGTMTYGDHEPWFESLGDNGKNGSTAVAYQLLEEPDIVRIFARMVARSWNQREVGHSGNFFSYVWGPPGALLAGPPALSKFMKEQAWYYDLARRWDHGLIAQPWPEKREGPNGMTNYANKGPLWGTGGIGLAYAIPFARLRILGATRSVFGQDLPPELNGVSALFDKKDYTAARDAAISAQLAAKGSARYLAGQIEASATRMAASVDLTLASIGMNMTTGDLYCAKCQLTALIPVLPAKDSRCEEWLKRIDDPANKHILETGRNFYEARRFEKSENNNFSEDFVFGKRSHGIMMGISKDSQAGAYQEMAVRLLSKYQ